MMMAIDIPNVPGGERVIARVSIYDVIKYRDEYHRQMSHSFALFAQHCFYDLNGKKFTVKDFHLQFFSTLQDVYDCLLYTSPSPRDS